MGKYSALFDEERSAAAGARAGKYSALFEDEPADQAASRDSAPSVGAAMFPRTAKSLDKGEGFGRKALNVGLDAASLIGRGIAALPERGKGGDAYLESLAETEGKTFAGKILRDPATTVGLATAPVAGGLALGRLGLTGLRAAAAAGAGEGLASAATHQAENISQGKGVNVGQAALETGLSAAVPVGIGGIASGIRALGKGSKSAISRLSDIPEEALQESVDPARLEQLRRAAVQNRDDLTPVADDLMAQVNTINQRAAQATDQARAQQLQGFENDLLGIRKSSTGESSPSIRNISAGARGEAIQNTLEAAKPQLQQRFREGDQALLGDLRNAPALTYADKEKVTGVGKAIWEGIGPEGDQIYKRIDVPVTELADVERPVLTGRIAKVLSDFKALSPEQGVPKITPGAEGAIKHLLGMAKDRTKTIDDLIDLKAQARAMQAGGKFGGELFDASRDDLAFAHVMEAIHQVEKESITKAVPDKADELIPLIKAHNELYGRTLDLLRAGDQRFRMTPNTERIIPKIESLGPLKSMELLEEAKSNTVIAPYVNELKKGFVDDLLLSSMKNGIPEPKEFAKNWHGISDDMKLIWLGKDGVSRIDNALSKAFRDIPDAPQVGKEIFGKAHEPSLKIGVKNLENIGTDNNRQALDELKFLDNILGLKGEKSFESKAMDFFRAKQLQITPEGNIPMLSNAKTGKFVGGLSYGEAIGGAVGAGMGALSGGLLGSGAGVLLGKYAGKFAGAYAQSPAGAVAAYRILSKLEQPVSTAVNFTERFGPRGINTLSRPLFRPEERQDLRGNR